MKVIENIKNTLLGYPGLNLLPLQWKKSSFKNVYYIFINALFHINTAPHTPSWQLPSPTTVSYCWLLDEGYILCSRAEGTVLVDHFVHADFPAILHF